MIKAMHIKKIRERRQKQQQFQQQISSRDGYSQTFFRVLLFSVVILIVLILIRFMHLHPSLSTTEYDVSSLNSGNVQLDLAVKQFAQDGLGSVVEISNNNSTNISNNKYIPFKDLPSDQKYQRLIDRLVKEENIDYKHTKKKDKYPIDKTIGTNLTTLLLALTGDDMSSNIPKAPVWGPPVTNGVQPLFDMRHQGGDAVFALASNYGKKYYQRFVGSLRKNGFNGDIVLAVSPIEKMKPGVLEYLKLTKVIAYSFSVDCIGVDNCKLLDDFLGYPDPRPYRTFANIRYALYEYWLQFYSEQSYILILDFRDTFFQGNPFSTFGIMETRPNNVFDLRVFAENEKVKTIGTCVYNALWVGRCFGRPSLAALKEKPVLCSGSTMGSFLAIVRYVRVMLRSFDTVKCWLKGIESDQGYQNFLFYNGFFDPPNGVEGNAVAFLQGEGIVNTIGALNGFRYVTVAVCNYESKILYLFHRVKKDKKGSLDEHWKIRDDEGYVLNNNQTRSVCVHQWDRWYSELVSFVDSKTY